MKCLRTFFVTILAICTFSLLSAHANSIGEIEMRFCNTITGQDTKELLLTGESQQAIPLCIALYNKSTTATSISINFVDGTITNDGSKKKACLEEWTRQMFGQYVTWIQTQTPYTLAWKSYLTLTGDIVFPAGYVGEVIGCLTYAIDDQQQKTWAINVFVRKANIIIVSLSGEIHRAIDFLAATSWSSYADNLSTNPQVMIHRDEDGHYILWFSLINNGNITESPTLQGTIENTRWRSQDLDITSKEIAAWIQSDYTHDIQLPRYGGTYTLTLSGHSLPIFLLPDSSRYVDHTGAIAIYMTTSFSAAWDIAKLDPMTLMIILWSMVLVAIICLIIVSRKHRKRRLSDKTRVSSSTSQRRARITRATSTTPASRKTNKTTATTMPKASSKKTRKPTAEK